MAVGDPIVHALLLAEEGTRTEIRVHLTRRLVERDPLKRARAIFSRFAAYRTEHAECVLLYVNLRRHRFAICADARAGRRVGEDYWKPFARELSENLRGTDPERAISLAIAALGERLRMKGRHS